MYEPFLVDIVRRHGHILDELSQEMKHCCDTRHRNTVACFACSLRTELHLLLQWSSHYGTKKRWEYKKLGSVSLEFTFDKILKSRERRARTPSSPWTNAWTTSQCSSLFGLFRASSMWFVDGRDKMSITVRNKSKSKTSLICLGILLLLTEFETFAFHLLCKTDSHSSFHQTMDTSFLLKSFHWCLLNQINQRFW